MNVLLATAFQENAQQLASPITVDQQPLDARSDHCHSPRTWLLHGRGNEVTVQASPDTDYNKIVCLLDRLQKSGTPVAIGFIGNAQASRKK
jgi:biopolymer transport protein ExbD